MRQELSFFQNTQVRNLIIFLIVSGFAIQALLLIIDYGHDIPGPDDIDQIFLADRRTNEDAGFIPAVHFCSCNMPYFYPKIILGR